MTTKLHRLTLTFRTDGSVDALFVREGPARRRHEIHGRFDEDGWWQWGEPCGILAENVCTMTRIRAILNKESAKD